MIDWSKMKTAEQLEAERINQERIQRVSELKRKLSETDYVSLPDYDRENQETLVKRQTWRNEIRELELIIDWPTPPSEV